MQYNRLSPIDHARTTVNWATVKLIAGQPADPVRYSTDLLTESNVAARLGRFGSLSLVVS